MTSAQLCRQVVMNSAADVNGVDGKPGALTGQKGQDSSQRPQQV